MPTDTKADYARWLAARRERIAANRRLGQELMKARRRHAAPPPGQYRWNQSQLTFDYVGKTAPLTRYHGTVQPAGYIIKEFRPAAAELWTRERPEIGSVPAVFTTVHYDEALARAEPSDQEMAAHVQGQIYEVTILPRRLAELPDGHDRNAARHAIVAGFDVIECPQHWEQAETIVLDPKVITVESVHRAEPGPYGPVASCLLYQNHPTG